MFSDKMVVCVGLVFGFFRRYRECPAGFRIPGSPWCSCTSDAAHTHSTHSLQARDPKTPSCACALWALRGRKLTDVGHWPWNVRVLLGLTLVLRCGMLYLRGNVYTKSTIHRDCVSPWSIQCYLMLVIYSFISTREWGWLFFRGKGQFLRNF